jgi:hypothetical protein
MPDAKIPVPEKAKGFFYKLRLWKARMKFHKSEVNTTINLPEQTIHATGCDGYTDLSNDQIEIDWDSCKNIVVKEKNEESHQSSFNTQE